MQFKLVLLGVTMLAIGLAAYGAIPNVHTTTILQTLPLPPPDPLQVPAGAVLELTQNLSIASTHQNTLLVNLTVTSIPGQSSNVLFQLFQRNQTRPCPETTNRSYILNQEVSNGTLRASISQSGQYCFVFDNEASTLTKTITMMTSINSSFVQIQTANDGEMNYLGLVAGAFGFVILVAGIMKKTVIPWE